MFKQKPIKILHVVYAMNTGGVETWLMSIYRNINIERIQFDFLVNTQLVGFFDEEIKQMGGHVIYSGPLSKPFYIYRKVSLLLKSSKYAAVHCHNVENSALVLKAAAVNNIKVRIYHSHNDFQKKIKHISLLKRIYLKVSNLYALHYANKLLAVSKIAGDSLFGSKNYQLLSLGIDVQKFNPDNETHLLKSDFNLLEDDFVIGHVGRFDVQKNHVFLIEIAKELIKLNSHSKFLLIGNGVLENEIKIKVRQDKLDSYFVFAGIRSDVPKIMCHVMDTFLFPSVFEGLGLVVVEAQASGLPIVCSDSVPQEAIINKALIKKYGLSKSARAWAMEVLKIYEKNKKYDKNQAYQKILTSPFDLSKTINILEGIWQGKR